MDEYIDYDDDDEAELRRRRQYYEREEDEEQIDEMRYIDQEDCRGKLHEWIKEE